MLHLSVTRDARVARRGDRVTPPSAGVSLTPVGPRAWLARGVGPGVPRYLYSIAGQVMVAGASTVRLFIVGRSLSAEDFGYYSLAFAVVLGCQTLFLGMTQTIGSVAPQKEGDAFRRFVTAAVLLQLGVAVVMVGGLCAAAVVFFGGRMRTLLLLSALALGASSLRFIAYPVQYSVLNFQRALHLDAFASISQTLVFVFLLLVTGHHSTESALGALAISECLWSCASVPLFRNYLQMPRGLSAELREVLAFGRYSLAASLSNYSLNYGSVLILGMSVPPAQLGGFAAAKNLARLNEPLTFALGNILRAETSRATVRDNDGALANAHVARTMRLGIAASMLSRLVLAVFYPLAFRILFAGKFLEFGVIVWIVSASKILESLAFFFVAVLNGTGSPDLVFRATLVCGTINLVLLAAGTHWFGVYGAAVATIVGATGYCGVLWRFLRQRSSSVRPVALVERA
jgi:O-antigen/teichoic acid export membrane protein